MTNTTILVATLMLSSGVCLSEAFHAASLFRGVSSSSSARFYAPKGSLDRPKRRRGRPRKNAGTPTPSKKKSTSQRRPRTSTTATAASAAMLDPPTTTTRKRVPPKLHSPLKQTTTSDVLDSMLDHDLLTKEEELQLGSQVQRARQVQATMAAWIEENKSRLLKKQEYEWLESIHGFYNDDDEEDDDIDSPLLGTAHSQAIERYVAEQGASEEMFYQDGTPCMEDMWDYTVIPPPSQQQQQSTSEPESWMNQILLDDNNSNSLLSSSFGVLTDEDIHRVLDLPGGRSQLRAILLEGALARERLIRSNVRLVTSIAKKWIGIGEYSLPSSLVQVYGGYRTGRPTLDEAIQEGILGLAEAAERYNPDRGFRFATYATMWVTNSVRKCFHRESSSGMRLPEAYYEIKRKYVNRVRYYLRLGEVPGMETLANDLGVSIKRLVLVVRLTQPLQSIDASIEGPGVESNAGYTIASLLACDDPQPEDHVERSLLRQCLENAMATELSPIERDVLRLRLGLDDGVPRTLKEVAAVFGGRFTVPAIRGIEQRAFNKLRSPFAVHTQQLMAYLDFAGIDGNNEGL